MRSFNLLPKTMIGSPLILLPDHVIIYDYRLLSSLSLSSSTTTMFNSEDIKSSLKLDYQGSDYETANYPPDDDCNSSSFSIYPPLTLPQLLLQGAPVPQRTPGPNRPSEESISPLTSPQFP